MGGHDPAEITALGCSNLTAVADFLGDKAYFLGGTPSCPDAVAYAFLGEALWTLDSPFQCHARTRHKLDAYGRCMCERYFADTSISAE